ncbi:MAG: CAAX prenyl protease-related protein, partial [Reinekea sp.]|nr:CAAX prenyl protease-related protein [Reinekea sp.]
MAFLSVENMAEGFPWLYPVKTVSVAIALWWYRDRYDELKPTTSWLAILVGIIAIVIWIGIDPYYPGQKEITTGNPPTPFDPKSLGEGAQWWVFMIFRVVGHVAVVPVMEELFWRSFLIRWIVNKNFKQVPHGTFT